MRSGRVQLLAADLFMVLLAGWLLWPQHAGGYGLAHDMVFTPHQPLNADSLGLGSSSPRAVPLDALVALAEKLIGGMALGRLALLVPLLAAGWGAIRLLALGRVTSLPAMLLAGGLAVWNPYLVERLALGQWALLWAYGALPWLIRAAHRLRCGQVERSNWAALVCALAVCAITPTGAIIGAAVAVGVAFSAALGRTAGVVLAGVLVQLPWLMPALLSSAAATSDPRAVAAFAARSERPGGTLTSLLGLGGVWSSEVTPASRAGALGYLSTLVVLVAVLIGGWLLAPRTLAVRLWVLGAAGLVLAAAASVPGLSALLRWAVRVVPGAGLLRDGQKWLMPFVLLAILGAGTLADRLSGRPASRLPRHIVLSAATIALPLLLLPDAPATLRVPLTPVHYPADWQQVAARLAGSHARVLVLPFASYRSFDWAPGRSVIDPAPRLLPAATVVDDRLVVGAVVLSGEDRAAADLGALLAAKPPRDALATELAGEGIGWVVVEVGTPGPALPDLGALHPVTVGTAVRLYQVPGPIARNPTNAGTGWLVIGVDLLVGLLVAAAFGSKAVSITRRLLHSPLTTTS